MNRVLSALFVSALLVTTAACGRGGSLRVVESLPEDLYSSPTPAPRLSELTMVRVWFVEGIRLVPVRRQVLGSRTAYETAVADLMRGPTPEEAARGLTTAIPPDSEVLGLEIEDAMVTVDLSREFELSAEQSVQVLRLAQVVYTLTDLPRVSRVRFEIDGQPVSVVGRDGALRDGPVRREDFSGLT